MKKIVIDTDIIVEHLTRPMANGRTHRTSVLRDVMSSYFCYTTVFNAIELFALCETAKQRRTVEDVMYSMKVLGLNGKSAKNVGELVRKSQGRRLKDAEALVAGVCVESKLPLLTSTPERYRGVRSLTVLTPESIGIPHTKGT